MQFLRSYLGRETVLGTPGRNSGLMKKPSLNQQWLQQLYLRYHHSDWLLIAKRFKNTLVLWWFSKWLPLGKTKSFKTSGLFQNIRTVSNILDSYLPSYIPSSLPKTPFRVFSDPVYTLLKEFENGIKKSGFWLPGDTMLADSKFCW